ncbi:four helix bundle protein [Candidatus Gottesmanbacteria bacterium RIFCSPLOWO2_01_FULL_46_9]|uniref:Four helix bundle protein n=1 Tax=Candidatus Gottesmanbacteria bacterium RIFCSPLOWO2_01_FULL_46_9 TaxID=1798394 RepID=A0A1F6B066_9BACT|nr:MAG: four helix bundle protein [Candidatus Gottesmanbacteria bacterium RIFCSPLOWO2_01_FULL_46_9]
MTEVQNKKHYDLEERTALFARRVRNYVNTLPKITTNIEYGKQLTRSSGSVGANYIEANESLSKKDFVMRVKICRKESKESRYWLELTEPTEQNVKERERLSQESTEFIKIFNAIIVKSE